VLLLGQAPRVPHRAVARVSRCLTTCQFVSPSGGSGGYEPRHMVTCLEHAKGPLLMEEDPDLRKLVAGAGFEPASSGL